MEKQKTNLPAKAEKPKGARKPRARKLKPEQVIAAKYSVEPEQVEKWRIEGGLVVVIINYGIKGTKKYKVPQSDFPQPLE